MYISRFIFWSDWGEIPLIERAGMDGSQETRDVIISHDITWPNGLTIDSEETQLYWTDARLSYIHSCDYFGEARNVVIESNLHHPFSLTFNKPVLYWSDWTTHSVHFYNTTTGERGVVVHNINYPMGIRAFMESRQPLGKLLDIDIEDVFSVEYIQQCNISPVRLLLRQNICKTKHISQSMHNINVYIYN